jgi:Mn-containing catalase
MRYFTQVISEDDAGRKDMLFDITTKEVSHLEIISNMFCMPNRGIKGKMPEGVEKAADLLAEFTQSAKGTPLRSYTAEVGGWWGGRLLVKGRVQY